MSGRRSALVTLEELPDGRTQRRGCWQDRLSEIAKNHPNQWIDATATWGSSAGSWTVARKAGQLLGLDFDIRARQPEGSPPRSKAHLLVKINVPKPRRKRS